MAYAERHGKGWRARWKGPAGRTPEWPGKSGFATKREAKEYAQEQEALVRQGLWIDPAMGEMALEKFRADWREAQDVAPKTLICYDQAWNRHIKPRWGTLGLRHIPPLEMKTWLKDLRERYSQSQVGIITSQLNGMFDTAAHLGYIDRSPMPPKAKRRSRARSALMARPAREGVVITRDEAEQILRRMPTWADVLMVVTDLFTGLRWSELNAVGRPRLRLVGGCGGEPKGWYVVDPRTGGVHEDQAARRYLGPPKSGATGRLAPEYEPGRLIDLAPFHVLLLDAYLRLLPPDQESLFLNTKGEWWRGGSWRTGRWRPACDGRPDAHNRYGAVIRPAQEAVHAGLVPHDMKHTHKAMLNDQRVHPVMQDYRLGHIPPGTPGVYSHPTAQMRRECVEAVERTWHEWAIDLGYWGVKVADGGVDMSGLNLPLTAVRGTRSPK